MTDQNLMIEITGKLAELANAHDIEQEQLIRCLAMMTGFMMTTAGIELVETTELEIEARAK